MSNNIKNISISILSLNRYLKRAIAVITDIGLCILSLWLAFSLRLEEFIAFRELNFYPLIISIIIAMPVFWLFGLYRTIFRHTGLSIIFTILASTSFYGFFYFLVIGVYSLQGIPRSIGIMQPMILFFLILGSRLIVKHILSDSFYNKKSLNKKNVLIYGAGDAGRQLAIALENSPKFKVSGFLDDNIQLHRQVLLGKTVYPPERLDNLINSKEIKFVFLALPEIGRNKRNKIIDKISKYKLIVKTLPSISEIVDGRITISDIKDLNINDLLNRDEIKPDEKLLGKNINFKTVVVTGAGGSIGSELCRQIARLKPLKILLLELNEYALYKIYEEIKIINKNLKIIPLLCNTQDQEKMEDIFETFNVDTVYHAAAYKHVPLVENNISEGIKNNVFSTLSVAKASVLKKVSNFVLISSDKAVRPTNIMGASKRLSELCVQGIHKENYKSITSFSIVRFGNVLVSSGSVIPKFKKQIMQGGPVTLTHKDVTRYFMTVTEAAQLVIQAGSIARNSEIFVLDMGESIKINDLIIKMINLSGFKVKDRNNLNGDIEIKITGLRPGEKLYEELLIGNDPKKTIHPKILMIDEPFIPLVDLEKDLNNLKVSLRKNDINNIKSILVKLVFYKSELKIVDNLFLEKTIEDRNSRKLSNNNSQIIKLRK